MKINVKVLLSRGMTMPAYATDGSAAIDLRECLEKRGSYGGPTEKSVEAQIAFVRQALEEKGA